MGLWTSIKRRRHVTVKGQIMYELVTYNTISIDCKSLTPFHILYYYF